VFFLCTGCVNDFSPYFWYDFFQKNSDLFFFVPGYWPENESIMAISLVIMEKGLNPIRH